MWDVLAALLVGVLCGIFTGLAPGIHTNLVSAVMLSISPALLTLVDAPTLGVFIISMSVVNAFLNAIPSIYLGAPDAETALSVLPGHRMLLRGRGYEAVKLTVLGSFWSLVLVSVLAPFVISGLVWLNDVLADWIGWLLLVIAVWMIFREKNKFGALFVFLLSGVLGLLVLGMDIKEPLFPLLSGLFGLSGLVTGLGEDIRIPVQRIDGSTSISFMSLARTVGVASFMGTMVGFFPGVGPAPAAVIGSQVVHEDDKSFLALVGGINTANLAASLLTFYALDKARNGAVVAVRELLTTINFGQFMLFLIVSLISGCIGLVLTFWFARHFAKLMGKVNYTLMCILVIITIVVLVPAISGWLGLLVLAVSTLAGMIAPLMGVSRSQAMGCLLLPVMLWFLL